MVSMSLAMRLREGNAAALDADEAKVGGAVGALDDLVGEADEGAFDLGGRHQAAFFAEGLGWALCRT